MPNPGPPKPCPLSSGQSSRPLGLSAQYACPWCGSSDGPIRATAAQPSANAGHAHTRERPCTPPQGSGSLPGAGWRPSGPGASHALWHGSLAIVPPGAMSCRPPKAGGVAQSMERVAAPCLAPATASRWRPPRRRPPPSGGARGGEARPRSGSTWCSRPPSQAPQRCAVPCSTPRAPRSRACERPPGRSRPLRCGGSTVTAGRSHRCLSRPHRELGRTGRACAGARAVTACQSWRCGRAIS